MPFTQSPYMVKKKFFVESFTNADVDDLAFDLNERLILIFNDEANYDVYDVKVLHDGTQFVGIISYYQVYQNSPDAEP